jgi:alpha-beta hydrolase superfamily lysophospholipase
VRVREWTTVDRRGLAVLRRAVAPDDAPRPAVVVVHGVGQSAAVLQPFARALAEHGLRAELLDLPGCGRSDGPRGDVDDFDHFVDDVGDVLDEARAAAPGGRAALYGHSLGALACALTAAARPADVAALAVTSAPFTLHAGLRDWSPPGTAVAPHLSEELGRAARRLDDAPAPFCPRVPVLALYGADDPALAGTAAPGWLAAHGRPDALVEVVPGGAHNLLDEPAPRARLAAWLAAMLGAALAVLAFAAVLCAAPAPAGAGSDPDRIWQTIESEHFAVHFYAGLYLEAVQVLDMAERAHALVTPLLDHVPRARCHIVLTDSTDGANGFAVVSPYPLINLYVSAPDASSAFNDYHDWMEALVTHELTHIVHLDTVHGLPAVFNRLFGLQWTPNGAMPRWYVEGLATAVESDLTVSGGRARSAYVDMHLRMAILAGTFPGVDDFGSGIYTWPRGDIAYYYGGVFLTWLVARYGYDALAAFNREFGTRPVPFALNLVARDALGDDFVTLYRTWREELRAAYEAERARVEAAGVRAGERLTAIREGTGFARLSPRGDLVAYFHSDAHDPAWLRVMPAVPGGEKASRRLVDDPGFNAPAWFPDGRALVAMRVEPWKNFYNYTDLFRIDLPAPGTTKGLPVPLATGVTRLTWGVRARFPDVSPDGRYIVFERAHAGSQDIAMIPAGGAGPDNALLRTVVESVDLSQCYTPRFSPDGRLVAFAWHRDGRMDIALHDLVTGDTRRVTDDGAVDLDPAFSPDGRWLYFASDRSGIYDLYAYELASGRLFQVTNVLGGAFQPDPSRDGRTLLYRAYGDGGFDLWRIAVAPETWPEVPLVPPPPPPTTTTSPAPGAAAHHAGSAAYPSASLAARAAAALPRVHPYHPWGLLLPRTWRPRMGSDPYGTALGLSSGASDPAGLHRWSASAAFGLVSRELTWSVDYAYTGLYPTLSVSGGRFAAARSDLRIDGARVPYVEEQYWFSAGASFSLNRTGGSHVLGLRYDGNFIGPDRPVHVVLDPGDREPRFPDTGYLGGVSLSWSWSNARGATYAVGSTEGRDFAVNMRLRDPALGSRFRSFEVSWRWEEFVKMPWGRDHVLAVRAAGGLSTGDFRFRRTYSIGGPPDQNLLLALATNARVGPGYLRGYEPGEWSGNRFALLNLEYRFPLAIIERGLWTVPLYVNRAWAMAYFDVGNAFNDPRDAWALKPAAGVELLVDTTLAYYFPVTLRVGVAEALAGIADPETRRKPQLYVVLGNTF